MSKLTPEQITTAKTAMLERMRQEFTFMDLYAEANAALGYARFDQSTPCYRLADRFIQQQRRQRRIVFERKGGRVVWSLRSPEATPGSPEFTAGLTGAFSEAVSEAVSRATAATRQNDEPNPVLADLRSGEDATEGN